MARFFLYPFARAIGWSWRLRWMDRCNRKRLRLKISICKLPASASALISMNIVLFILCPIYRTRFIIGLDSCRKF